MKFVAGLCIGAGFFMVSEGTYFALGVSLTFLGFLLANKKIKMTWGN